MNAKKLFTVTIKNNLMKSLMSTQTDFAETLVDKKLQHYRNLNALENNDTKPADWDQAKPYEDIPGPEPLPLIGNTWRFLLPKFGNFYGMDIVEIHKQMHQQYGDITIMKGMVGLKPIVVLFNPSDTEKLHRNEGVWPVRMGLPSFAHYRKLREDVLSSGGLVALQGEEWFKFRTVVNPILMQPKNVIQYVEKMNFVADELIENIRYFSEKNEQGQMPDDFHNELYKWSLESIGVVTMDTHLGCLRRNKDNEEAQRLIYSVIRMFQLMYKLDIMPSLWKYISTPSWKEYVRTLDFILETNLKYIKKYIEKIEKGESKNDSEVTSALHQMIKINRSTATAMAVDMMTAGVDTTARILAAALYYLAKNPQKQKQLRTEVNNLLKTKDAPVTKQTLSENSYTKAVIKETTRLSPIAIGNMRTTKKDLVLGGYRVPSGTDVLTSNLILCQQEQHFPKAGEFLPERWLKTTEEMSYKGTNPFVFAPFGFGPRSCIGKRLANLELETALMKIIRNFDLKWPHEDMVFYTKTLHGMARPLRIHVKSLDS